MPIYVDADACPVVIKDILCRAAQRSKTKTIFIANQNMTLPRSPYVSSIRVAQGFDEADKAIVERVTTNDLVITGDIPLAADAIKKGAQVLTSRGEVINQDNITNRLNMRDFMETLRSSGVDSGGPAPLSPSDRQQFANKLDQYLNKYTTQ